MSEVKHTDVKHNQDVKYTPDQQKTLEWLTEGRSFVLTGKAGTGKTFLVKEMIRICQENKVSYAVTATTGNAAVLLNGRTLHSWAGLGLGQETLDALYQKIARSKNRPKGSAWNRIQTTTTLFIDEISMLESKLFTTLNQLCKKIRKSELPFGGLQVIAIGDFCQLPPVVIAAEKSEYLFECQAWKECFQNIVYLKHVFRQSDPTFVELLSRVRDAALTPQDIEFLRSKVTSKHPIDADGLSVTLLHSRRAEVELHNEKELATVKSQEYLFERTTFVVRRLHSHRIYLPITTKTDDRTKQTATAFTKHLNLAQTLKFKVGCPVILTVNLDQSRGLVNGSRGVITHIDNQTQFKELITVKFGEQSVAIGRYAWKQCLNEKEMHLHENAWTEYVEVKQIPLILAYALTIHKSQGLSLSAAHISAGSEVFEAGQAYTAMSRVTHLDRLTFSKFEPGSVKSDPKIIEFYRNVK